MWLLLLLGALLGGAFLSSSGRPERRQLLPPPGRRLRLRREIELVPGSGYWKATDQHAVERERSERARELEEHARMLEAGRELEGRVEAFIDVLAPFEKYDNPLYVDDFARAYRDKLLADRENIVNANAELHTDRAFVRLLKETSHTSYLRATFKVRALARAEELDVALGPHDRRPNDQPRKETPAAYRARKTAHIRRQGALAIATMDEKVRVVERARKRWAEQGLDVHLRELLEQELKTTLSAEDDDDAATERYS